MAQKGRRKQAPAYSADTLAIRFMAGLALLALGVLIFMAVDLRMQANIFTGLRTVCFGLCGSMANILAILPLWAGGLVIWSTQRKAPALPCVYGFLSFVGICVFIMLISGNAMDLLDRAYGSNWGGVIQGSYSDCSRTGMGGGAVGALLAWPLWKYLGTIAGVAIMFLVILFCLLMMVNLTPSRIGELITGKKSRRREQQEYERARAEEQQVAWQQQQAAQAAAWQQQQARIIEQQQQQPWPQQNPQQPWPQQNPRQPWPQQPAYGPDGSNGVADWQDQVTAQQTAADAANTGHQSRIFGKQHSGKETRAEKGSWKSRIFGKKEEEYDGLVDQPDPASVRQQVEKAAEAGRRTATGMKITRPETRWKPEEEPAEETPVQKRPGKRPAAAAASAQNMDAYRRPAAKEPVRDEEPVRRDEPARTEEPARKPEPARREEPARNEEPARRPKSAWQEQVSRKEEEIQAKPVPAVQQTIGEAAYKPPVKLPAKVRDTEPEEEFWAPTPYNYPPITDLAMPKASAEDTAAEDGMRSRKLEETLASFKVQARVVHVTHGPAISRFEMELAAGTKVNNVAKLEKDIAYGMEATSIRIEAPIPGKSLVGVEVPNRKVATVTLREVLQSERMQNAKSLLTVALGKDIAGIPIVCDLAKMPHMLIAGQTGSGKSVCINAIINSLLYRASPDEVKLILVDPKVVELQCYNGIPHLLIPVVNDPHKAAAALAWAVAERMERYDKFAERKVRTLDGYNADLGPHEKPMARIVIIIDELADLMMVCKKDVEEYICRLTQLARAAGIHLIVATQRPSVDVITGLIKANIPSRIAFKTASQVDSRTILDRVGSETLLGWGDMLYLPTGSFAPTRVQGCFLSDEEVNRIASHVRDANPSTYDPDILEKLEEITNGGAETTGADMISGYGDSSGGDGNLFEQAVEFAISDGQISTSTLQRRLKIGYARAGRLTDEMEERGIVAAKDGSKPRKCLITREEWESMKQASEGMT